MDFIKKAAQGMKGKESGSSQSSSGGQDYVDKGRSFWNQIPENSIPFNMPGT
jgi:hypothetical protein